MMKQLNPHKSIKLIHILFLLISTLLFPTQHEGKEFNVEGSDLLIGIGAKAIGLSGAVTAGTNGIYSAYWNPAGLAEENKSEVSLSSQLNSKILPANFIGAMFSPSWLQHSGYQSSFSISWIPRLYMKSKGAYTENDIESVFLRLTLPGLAGDFDGVIKSKTKDYRLSWAIMPEENPRWSLGVSLSRVDCKTFFCGVTAEQPGEYIITSTKASAYAVHMGAKFYYNKDITFGINFKDLNTALSVGVKTEYQNGTAEFNIYKVKLPKDVTIGVQWQYNDIVKTSLDYQNMFGNYGRYAVDFRIVRFGVEYTDNHLHYRSGFIAPLKLSAGRNLDYTDLLLFPIAPSLGLGWNGRGLTIDTALYAQLVMSAQRKKLVPGFDLVVTYPF